VAEQATDTPILNVLAGMTAVSLEATTLDKHDVMLARIAALVASDAPPISYVLNLGSAGDTGVDAEEIRGVFTAIAPIVGTARIATAVGNIVKALALEELAEIDSETTA
jgi:alkylhydroperoxidase/carboxymuconolactone decarboxylase family protein YurZ